MVLNTDSRSFVSLSALARRLEVSRPTARRVAAEAGFATDSVGKHPRFRRDDLERFVERHRSVA
jgi:excisionase family DNA binding protein